IAQVCGSSYPTPYPTPYPYPYNGTISITGVNGPNSLAVNQQGTWTVTTNAPSGTNVSTSVNWGDQNTIYPYANASGVSYTNQQNTFSHSYSYPGTYTIVFTVTDNNGHTNNASQTVVVGGSNTCSTSYYGYPCNGSAPTITSLSPNSGAVGTQMTIYGS